MTALFPTIGDVVALAAWLVLIALWLHAARSERKAR